MGPKPQPDKPHKDVGGTAGLRFFREPARAGDSAPETFPYGLGAGMDVQPVVDLAHMETDRIDAQAEHFGAGLVTVTFG